MILIVNQKQINLFILCYFCVKNKKIKNKCARDLNKYEFRYAKHQIIESDLLI